LAGSYSATKAALRSFAQCLRLEVKGYGVKVAVVAPWHIRTTLPQEEQVESGSPYAETLRVVKDARDRMMNEAAPPAVVASAVLKVLLARNPRSFYSVGKGAALQAFLVRHLPSWIVERQSMRRFGLK
jgi:short-subunit dehydrogenase